MVDGLTDASSLTSYIFSANPISSNNNSSATKLGEVNSGETFDSILQAQDSSKSESTTSTKASSGSGGGSSSDNEESDPMDLNGDGTVSLEERLQYIASQQFNFQAGQNGSSNGDSNFLETLFNRSQFENAYKQASNFVSDMTETISSAINAAV